MKQPVGIGFIIDDLGPGGAQRQLVELVLRLNPRAFAPYIYYYADPTFHLPVLQDAGIPVHRLHKRLGLSPQLALQLAAGALRHKFRLLQGSLAGPNLYAATAAQLLPGCMAIASERSNQPDRPRRVRMAEGTAYRLAQAVIANTHTAKQRLIDDYRLPAQKIYVIHNGVDVERFTAADATRNTTRAALRIANEERLLLMVGRPSPEKNHLALVQALVQARTLTQHAWKLLIVGSAPRGDYATALKHFIEEAGVSDRVLFHEPAPDIERFYAAADAVVLASLWEGCPNVVLEAQAAGRPILASRISDMSRLVDEKRSGWLFDPTEVASIASIMLNLNDIESSTLRQMGAVGRARMHEHFSVGTMVARTERIYERLLSQGV